MKSKAIQLYQLGVAEKAFRFIEIEVPNPDETEIQIEVEFSGINFAEVLARRGLYPEAPKTPYVPGYEVVGKVIKIGNDQTIFKVGDRVAAGVRFGGYSSCVNAKIIHAYQIPSDLEAGIALALVTQGSTAWLATNQAIQIYENDIVLVQAAAGGVGSLITQLAKLKGATVIGTASTEEKLQYLTTIGVDHKINYKKPNYFKEISNILGAIEKALKTYNIVYWMRLSFRDPNNKEKYLGTDARWENSQEIIKKLLDKKDIPY